MDTEREYSHNMRNKIEDKIYNIFLAYGHYIACAICIASAVALILDVSLFRSYFDKIQDQDFYSMLTTIVPVIWTFSTALIVFYLGHMGDRSYGIRLIAILHEDLGKKKIFILLSTFYLQLPLFILAAITNLFLTSVCCTVYQLYAVLYIFMLICVESSTDHVRSRVIRMVAKEIIQTDEESSLLPHVICSVHYENPQEREELVRWFYDTIKECSKIYKGDLSKRVRDFSKSFMEMVISAANNPSQTYNMAVILLNYEKDVKNKKGSIDESERQGILASVLRYMDDASVYAVLNTEIHDPHSLLLWGMAYCIYYSRAEELMFLQMRAKRIKEILNMRPEKANWKPLEELLEFWLDFVKEDYDDKSSNKIQNLNLCFDLLHKNLLD